MPEKYTAPIVMSRCVVDGQWLVACIGNTVRSFSRPLFPSSSLFLFFSTQRRNCTQPATPRRFFLVNSPSSLLISLPLTCIVIMALKRINKELTDLGRYGCPSFRPCSLIIRLTFVAEIPPPLALPVPSEKTWYGSSISSHPIVLICIARSEYAILQMAWRALRLPFRFWLNDIR